MSSASENDGDQKSKALLLGYLKSACWRSLFHFTAKSHYVVLASALVVTILSSIIIPAFAYLLGKSFNAFTSFGAGRTSKHEFLGQVSQQALYMTILGTITLALSACFLFSWLLFGELQATNASRQLYSCMLGKEMEWFDKQKSGTNALLTRIQSHLHELKSSTSQPLGLLCQYSCTILVALGLALHAAWDLTLVIIVTTPIGAALLAILSKRLQVHIERQAVHLETSVKHTTAALSAITTVKCANAQEFELQQYADSIRKAAAAYIGQVRLNATQIGFTRFLTLVIFVQGFWYGSHLVASGRRDSAQILTAFWACLIATQTFEGLLQHLLVLEKGCLAAEVMHSILGKNDKTRQETQYKLSPAHCEGDIQLREVSFAYPSSPEVLVLDRVNMFFAARETTFIVGKSGSGKSTLLYLLLGFYAASGKLTIDGKLIDSLDQDWLRNNISVISQQSVLFNDSILRNIAFGVRAFESIGAKDIEQCVRSAALDSTIMELPHGINTIVGPGGSHMSGGQRQRISLARARLRDTPVLIFDEATSALDRDAADSVMQNIRQWRYGKTTIIITHDLSQVMENDYVYVMDSGRIVEEGYRNALEKTDSHGFRELAGLQRDLQTSPLSITIQTNPHQSANDLDISTSSECLPSQEFVSAITKENRSGRSMTRAWADIEATKKSSGQLRVSVSREREGVSPQVSPKSAYPSVLPGVVQLIQSSSSKQETGRSNKKSFMGNEQDDRFQEDHLQPSSATNHEVLKTGQILSLPKIFSTVWPNLNGENRVFLVIGLLAATGHALATPVFSMVFSKLIETYMDDTSDNSRASLQWSLAVLAVAVSDGALSFCMHHFLEVASQSWVDTLRKKAYQRILYQPQSWFDGEGQNTHNLVDCLNRSGEETRNLLGRFVGLLTAVIVMTIVAISWSLVLCWKLTLVCLACGPLVHGLAGLFDSTNMRWESQCNSAAQSVSESFTETFGNIFTVRALTLENYFHGKNSMLIQRALITGVKRAIYSGLFFGTSDTAILLVIALLFWYSSQLIVYHDIPVQVVLTVLSMLLFTLTSIISTITFIPQLNTSQDMASQLLRLVNLKDQPLQGRNDTRRSISLDDSITISNLSFIYQSRPQQTVIENLILTIPLGASTAVVGPSGSGKSTLISLLLGLYTTTPSTAIRIDLHPLCEIDSQTLRQLIALSPQFPPIFPTSIKANIAYALPATSSLSSMDNVTKAASLAGLHAFVSSLPKGYDTLIGQGGSLLSGGQTARLGLARALCRQPRILILDEPTAGLDGLSRTELVGVIQELVRDCMTVIVATHDKTLQAGCQHVVSLAPRSLP